MASFVWLVITVVLCGIVWNTLNPQSFFERFLTAALMAATFVLLNWEVRPVVRVDTETVEEIF